MFDRTTWIAIIVSIAGLVGWQYYYNKTYGPYLAQQAAMKRQQEQKKQAASTPSPSPAAVASATPVSSPSVAGPSFSSRKATVDTSRAEYLFANDTGGIESVTLFLHLGANEQSLFLNKDSGMPIGTLCDASGTPVTGFTMEEGQHSRFTRTSPDGVVITKNFSLPQMAGAPEKDYLIGLDVTFRNGGSAPVTLPGYFVAAGGEAPVHTHDLPTYTCFDWYRDGKMTSIDVNWFEAGKIPLVGIQTRPARDLYSENGNGIGWAAVTSQYFTTIVTSAKDHPASGVWARRYLAKGVENTSGQPIYGITGGIGTGTITLAPGESVTRRYEIFAGPKDFTALSKLGDEQQKVMNFGMFHLVSEFLLWAMNSIQKGVHSYAAAIIILTILIKSALWPLQNKATSSMKRMQLLSPKMTELREKYKDEPTKMNEELMKLYKQYGVNPFGGCLPMLIQIPIFFGFYSMLGSAIELRNSHFLWIHDLSQPDTIAHIVGFPINLLPILMGGTMLWQMAISPKSGDPSQQRIMYFMPVIFLTFCYNYASGLALYWTTQNLFSIVQLYWTRNQPLPTLEKVKTPPKAKGGGGSGKKR